MVKKEVVIINYDNFYLREVKEEDAVLLFHWANEPEVRRNSLHTSTIRYTEHMEWFRNKLVSIHSDLFIYGNEHENVGHIRLEYDHTSAMINFSIDKGYRCKGYGSHMLILSEEYLTQNRKNINCMNAIVKKENMASQKAFLKLNYSIEERDCQEYIYFYKYLSTNQV